jgi:hypothetical protein
MIGSQQWIHNTVNSNKINYFTPVFAVILSYSVVLTQTSEQS